MTAAILLLIGILAYTLFLGICGYGHYFLTSSKTAMQAPPRLTLSREDALLMEQPDGGGDDAPTALFYAGSDGVAGTATALKGTEGGEFQLRV